MDILIKASDISKSIKDKLLFQNVNFDIFDSDCIGLLGPNGCGKTTLFKIMLDQDKPTTGDLYRKENINIRYLDQTTRTNQDKTVKDFFARTTDSSPQTKIKQLEKELEDPNVYNTNRYEEILEQLNNLKISVTKQSNVSRWESSLKILKELGMENLEPSTRPQDLSGGEWQKIAIASIFAQPKDVDLLFLDEPTNHLDIETIEWLERQIIDFPKAVVIVSHDRYLLDDLVDRVFEIQDHTIDTYDSTYEEYEEQKALRQTIKIKAYEKSKKEINRQKKIIQTLTRRNRYDLQIASKMKKFSKMQHVENPVIKSYLLKFHFKSVFKSGKNVAEGNQIQKNYESKTIFENLNFEILAGQKIGLIGPNGCGKTTFLKLLTKELKEDKGTLHISSGVRTGYFDQGHLSLKEENTLLQELLRDQEGMEESDAKALLGQFNFKGDIIYNNVKQISGGERARLAILRLLLQPYNLLLLDEPTNHMDMDSKKAIEGALNSYDGTVIAVSHDRRFLDNVVDTIYLVENKEIKEYTGNYTSFKLQRQKELEDMSSPKLAYLSSSGLKRYVVQKAFTVWAKNKRYNVGQEVYIGEHNEKLFEWAIKSGALKEQ